MNRPISSCQSLEVFPCDFRPHFHPYCYCSPCTLTFIYFILTLTHLHTLAWTICSLCNIFPLPSGCLHHIMSFQMPHSLRNLSGNFELCSEFTQTPICITHLISVYANIHSVTQQMFIELTFVFDIILVVQVSRLP